MPAQRSHWPSADEKAHLKNVQSVSSLLQELYPDSIDLADPRTEPGRAFRLIYEGWIRRGGEIRGKPRYSVRRISNWLDDERTEVKSLPTKLAGKTLLRRSDALSLFRLFLKRWSFDKQNGAPLSYETADLEAFAEQLADELCPDGRASLQLPIRSRDMAAVPATSSIFDEDSGPTRPSRIVIPEQFARTDALITVSRLRTFLGIDPANQLKLFRERMNELFNIECQDERFRALIWIVDLGNREDTDEDRHVLLNLLNLQDQFKALATIEPIKSIELWKWLLSHVAVIVGGLSQRELSRCYDFAGYKALGLPESKQDQPWFIADRLLLYGKPDPWLRRSNDMVEAFGRDQADLWSQPKITAHLAIEGGDEDESNDSVSKKGNDPDNPHSRIRYYIHAIPEKWPHQEARCLELDPPGRRYSDGYRLAATAAFGRLERNKSTGSIADPDEAIALLSRQGFAVLLLEEFLDLDRHIRANAFEDSDLYT